MKSNFIIQAELNIKQHPEWNKEEKHDALLKGKIKELTYGKRYEEYKHQLFDLIIGEAFDRLCFTKNPMHNSFVDWPVEEVNFQNYINEPIWRHPIMIRHKED